MTRRTFFRWASLQAVRFRMTITLVVIVTAVAAASLTGLVTFESSPWSLADPTETETAATAEPDETSVLVVMLNFKDSAPSPDAQDAWARAIEDAVDRLPGVTVMSEAMLAAKASERVRPMFLRLGEDPEDQQESIRQFHKALDTVPPPTGCEVLLSGWPAIQADINESVRADQHTLLPAAAIVFALLLLVAFRRFWGMAVPLATVCVAMAWFVGFLVIAESSLGLLSNVLPVMVFIIGAANCIHVMLRHAYEVGGVRTGRRSAAVRTLRHMTLPCVLTVATTAIGFGTLRGAGTPALSEFADQAVVALGLLLGAMFWMMCGPMAQIRHPRGREVLSGHLARFAVGAARVTAQRPVTTLLVGAGVLIVALGLARNSSINSYIGELYEPDHHTRRALRLVEEEVGGFVTIEVTLSADDPAVLLDERFAQSVLSFQKDALNMAGVKSAVSYADAYETGNLLARAGLAAEAKTQRTVRLGIADVGTARMTELVDQLHRSLEKRLSGADNVRRGIGGRAVSYAGGMRGLIHRFLISFGSTSVVIFVLIGLLFRSVRVGLIAVVPNLAPLAVTWGYMGLRGYDMNASNVIVFAVGLGMAVDNSVHVLARFREEIARDGLLVPAILRSYRGAGTAVVLTTVLIVIGLGVLMLSPFLPTQRFAELVGVTMLAALAGDILLLPACLAMLWRKQKPAPASDG